MKKDCDYKIGNRCESSKNFYNRLINRETKKAIEISKNDLVNLKKDVRIAIESGMIDTKKVWDDDNYFFARAIVSNVGNKIALGDEGEKIKKQLKYL